MVELSAAQITGIVFLGMVLSGAVVVSNMSQSYYCESEDNVKECFWISDTGITCRYLLADDLIKGDRCTGGTWEPLEGHVVDQQAPAGDVVKVRANGKDWICETKDGQVGPYTLCKSGSYEGYLGEFI